MVRVDSIVVQQVPALTGRWASFQADVVGSSVLLT